MTEAIIVEAPGLDDGRRPDLLESAEAYVRANPGVALMGAVAVGFAVGLIARSLEKEPEPEPVRDVLRELRSMVSPFAKRTRKAYADSSDSVRSALETAAGKARDLDTEPLQRWWRRLWG